MSLAVLIHVIGAVIGLLSGFLALGARKGSPLHRTSGKVFVYAMLGMASTGAAIAAFRGQEASIIAGLLTAYLVVTGVMTVRPATAHARALAIGACAVALVVGIGAVTLGFAALGAPRRALDGVPFVAFFMFGTVALLAARGDVRILRAGQPRGVPRLTRHIWRMCYALWIASASFFQGPRARVAAILPEPLLHPLLLAVPTVLVLAAMIYWLLRIRKGSLTRIVSLRRTRAFEVPGNLRGADVSRVTEG